MKFSAIFKILKFFRKFLKKLKIVQIDIFCTEFYADSEYIYIMGSRTTLSTARPYFVRKSAKNGRLTVHKWASSKLRASSQKCACVVPYPCILAIKKSTFGALVVNLLVEPLTAQKTDNENEGWWMNFSSYLQTRATWAKACKDGCIRRDCGVDHDDEALAHLMGKLIQRDEVTRWVSLTTSLRELMAPH